jgi:hypothetical protein
VSTAFAAGVMPSFVSTAEAWWSTVPHGQHQARGDLGVGQAVGYQGEDPR